MRAKTAWLTAGGLALAIAGLKLASRLPEVRHGGARRVRSALDDTELGRSAAKRAEDHPGQSGIHLLADGSDAFATRMLLIRTAQKSLDLQYYIWHGDRTGTMMLEAVREAAERGVKVRLLLDDNGISGLDDVLAVLDSHPNIKVRLFNPFAIRWPKWIGFALEFTRLNRRMHNKSFTADDAVTIVGGRNVGDEYFGGDGKQVFADLDVLAIGSIVGDISDDFERYWNASASYPAGALLRRVDGPTRKDLKERASLILSDPAVRDLVERLTTLPLVRQLVDGSLPLEWARVELVSDDPGKVAARISRKGQLAGKLEARMGRPLKELKVIAGYFVPGKRGTDQFCRLARQGVKVSILTNAFESIDVKVVHTGYAAYRNRLLRAGIHLFEMRRGAWRPPSKRERRKGTKIGVRSRFRGSGTGTVATLRSGTSTLHAKTFVIDRERLFVGSFNFDPRSFELNTEMGVLIDSAPLAGRVADAFFETVRDHAYRVVPGRHGALRWIERNEEREVVHQREPNMALRDRIAQGILRSLPIEWLL